MKTYTFTEEELRSAVTSIRGMLTAGAHEPAPRKLDLLTGSKSAIEEAIFGQLEAHHAINKTLREIYARR